jgi:hypothetical protein
MNILSLLGVVPKPVLPSATGVKIEASARAIIENLKAVQNMAKDKGHKVDAMYQKSMYYAKELATSAAKGKVGSTLENIRKLDKHATGLLPSVVNRFNEDSVKSIGYSLSTISNLRDCVRLMSTKTYR